MNRKADVARDNIQGLIASRDLKRAKRACERLLQQTLKANGKSHHNTAAAHALMGQVMLGLKCPKEAIAHLEKAMGVFRAEGHLGDMERADCLVWLFTAKTAAKVDRKEAIAPLMEASVIRRDILAPDNPAIAEILSAVSLSANDEWDEDQVRPYATAAISMAEHMYGTGYVACLAIEALIEAYTDGLENEAKARPDRELRVGPRGDIAVCLCDWVIMRYGVLFGIYNERLIEPLGRLAELYEARGETDLAVAALERKKAIKDRLTNLTVADRMEHLNTLDRLYERADDRSKQIGVLTELLALHEEDVEMDYDSEIAAIADRLGTACLAHDDFGASFVWFRRAAGFQPDDDAYKGDAILYRFHLGNAYEEHGKRDHRGSYRKALVIYRDTLRLARRCLGREDELVPHILSAMGNVLSALKCYGEAARCHREALKIRKTTLGTDDASVADSLNDLALVHIAAGKHQEARRLLRRALPIAVHAHGRDHSDLVPVLNTFGLACAGCKDYERAIDHLNRAVQIVEDTFGVQSINLVPQLQNLGDVYATVGRKDHAESVFRRALGISIEKQGATHPDSKELEDRIADLGKKKRPVQVGQLWTLQSDPQWQAEPETAPKSE